MIPKTTPKPSTKPLSSKQQQAAQMLAQGQTIAAVAKAVGVNEKTIDDWKKRADFRHEIEAAQKAIFTEAMRLLTGSVRAAITCLIVTMDKSNKPYVRVMAASKLLDISMDYFQLTEIQERLSALEAETMEGVGGGGGSTNGTGRHLISISPLTQT
jgi:transposase-like protein